MNTFKKKLGEAIDAVLSEMSSLSPEELRSEISSYLHDDRTSTLLYAWNSETTYYSECTDKQFDFSPIEIKNQHISSAPSLSNDIPSLFADELPQESVAYDHKYEKRIASDDYFFRAAA